MGGRNQRSSSAGDLLGLLLLPLVWLLRVAFSRRRPSKEDIKRFYHLPEWKRLRYAQLEREPVCRTCGATAATARMNVDHLRPIHRYWHLRLDARNLQTLCASCNWGKGGRH